MSNELAETIKDREELFEIMIHPAIAQQKIQSWLLKQKYLSLNPEYNGFSAWEIAGKILEILKS